MFGSVRDNTVLRASHLYRYRWRSRAQLKKINLLVVLPCSRTAKIENRRHRLTATASLHLEKSEILDLRLIMNHEVVMT